MCNCCPTILMTLPRRPAGTVAQLIYSGRSMVLCYAVLTSANGPFTISADRWRLLQLLQRSGSRFI